MSAPGRIVAFRDDTPEVIFDLGARLPLVLPLPALDCRNLAEACDNMRRGLMEKAASELEKMRPAEEALIALASVRIITGRDEEALRELDSLPGRSRPDPRLAALNGVIQLKAGRLEPAERQFQMLRSKPGLEALANCGLGHVRLLQGRLEEALALYREADRMETRLSFRFDQAAALVLSGQPHPARRVLNQLIETAPRLAEAYLLLGLADLSLARPEAAAAALLRAQELGAEHPVLTHALGTACQAAELHKLAADYLHRTLAAAPENEELRDRLVVSLLHSGRKSDAARILIESPVLQGQDAPGHFLLGLKLLLCEQPRAAAHVLFRTVAMGKRDADTFFALGQALLLDDHPQEAQLALQIAVRIAPRRQEIRFMLAMALAQNNQIEQALAELRQATAYGNADRDALQLRMELSRQNGDLRGCISDARRLLQLNPGLLEARFHLALCLAESGELEEALRNMKLAIESDREGEATSRALRLLKQLTEEQAAVAGWHMLEAQIHRWRGDWSEAVLAIEKFLLLAPSPRWSSQAAGWLHELNRGGPRRGGR